jgi:hypothetical protein
MAFCSISLRGIKPIFVSNTNFYTFGFKPTYWLSRAQWPRLLSESDDGQQPTDVVRFKTGKEYWLKEGRSRGHHATSSLQGESGSCQGQV